MGAETPEEQYYRLRDQIQSLVLRAYPNPTRQGCPGLRALENIAKWSGDFKELEAREDYQHVMHCSPCYREYLDTKRELQSLEPGHGQPMPKRVQRRLARTLNQLERVMKSVIP